MNKALSEELKEIYVPLHLVCKLVNRTAQTLRNDQRARLVTISKLAGVRSPSVRADRLNSYIRKKHFGRVQPVTVESLEALMGGAR
jgi:hypothetical protein